MFITSVGKNTLLWGRSTRQYYEPQQRKYSSDSYPACECFPTLRTDEGRRDKVRVVIAFEVHVKELFLAESLVAVAAGIRLLPGVSTLVHDHVPLLKEWGVEQASEPGTGLLPQPPPVCMWLTDFSLPRRVRRKN